MLLSIRQFDRDICIKANKQALLNLEQLVDNNYIKKKAMDKIVYDLDIGAKAREEQANKVREDLEKAEK